MTEVETPVKPKQVRKQDITVQGVMSWKLLEQVLKHYWEFKALLEDDGIDEITLDNGVVVNFHDLLQGFDELPPKQRTAIDLICIQGYREVEAAKLMNYESWSSPVGSLKRAGLKSLCRKYWNKEEPKEIR